MLKYYAYIQDEKLNGCGQAECLSENITNIEISEEVFNNISYYVWDGEAVVLNPNWEQEEYKKNRIAEILAELETIDNKSIRAIRANDTDYIAMYETQAEELREELRSLQK